MEAIFDLIGDVGVPIAMALVMGVFIFLIIKQIMEGIVITAETDCFDLCDILRMKLSGYVDNLNLHIMNDGSGSFMGCMCR